MGYLSTIPTRASVEAEWKRYQALALVVGSDPVLSADPLQQIALASAHARYAETYEKWCAR